MVYEDFHEFNQEQYHADVRIFDQRIDSNMELHIFHGISMMIDMAVDDAAHSAVAHFCGELSHLYDSEF